MRFPNHTDVVNQVDPGVGALACCTGGDWTQQTSAILQSDKKALLKWKDRFITVSSRLRPQWKINEVSFENAFVPLQTGRKGSFDAAFPELSSMSNGLATLDIKTAVNRLEAQTAATEKSVSLLGFNVPIAQLAQWGSLILLAVQLYLWIHLHEISNKIENGCRGMECCLDWSL